MARTLTEEQNEELVLLLIEMSVPKEACLTILSAIETPEELLLFLNKLSEKNYEMTPQEVYQAALETVIETT